MTKVTVKTKNGGDVKVTVYENLDEATKALSKAKVLKYVNRQIRTDTINKINAENSLDARLKKALKAGKLTEEDIEKMLK